MLTGVIRECKQQVPTGKQNLSEAALFCKSDPAAGRRPDLQIAFVHVPFDIIVGQTHPNAISILPGVVRPLSRGWVRLSSADPLVKPRVNPNYLAAKADRDRLVQGVKLAREIFATKAFSDWVGEELLPGPRRRNSDDDLNAFVTQKADSYHHQAGSCRMGLDELAVVDPELRVHGVEGLRDRRRERHAGRAVGQLPRGDRDDRRALRRHDQDDARPAPRGCRDRLRCMSLEGKKIAVLMEADYYEPEIWYYQRRFPEEGAEVHFLTRLWGQERLTFAGHEWKVPFEVDDELRGHGRRRRCARTRRSSSRRGWSPTGSATPRTSRSCRRRPSSSSARSPSPAVLKGIICHGMWLVAPAPELVRGRPVVAHNNLHGDVTQHGRDLHRRGRRRRRRPRHRHAPAATATCSRAGSSSCSSDGRQR